MTDELFVFTCRCGVRILLYGVSKTQQCDDCNQEMSAVRFVPETALAAARKDEFERTQKFFAELFNGSIPQDYTSPQESILSIKYEDTLEEKLE